MKLLINCFFGILISFYTVTKLLAVEEQQIQCYNEETGKGYPCDVINCYDTDWSNFGTGRQRRDIKQLICESPCYCKTVTIEYRCLAGYYSNDGRYCTKCPCVIDAKGSERCGTNPIGSIGITSCRMGNGYTFNDEFGNYEFVSDCLYTP